MRRDEGWMEGRGQESSSGVVNNLVKLEIISFAHLASLRFRSFLRGRLIGESFNDFCAS